MQTMAMRNIQRCKQRQSDIYKDVNKGNEIDIQRCKQSQWYIYIQRCKQRQWDIYKDVTKGNAIYTKR